VFTRLGFLAAACLLGAFGLFTRSDTLDPVPPIAVRTLARQEELIDYSVVPWALVILGPRIRARSKIAKVLIVSSSSSSSSSSFMKKESC